MNLKTKAWLAHPWGALRQLRLSITVSAAYPRWAHGRKGSGNACAGYRPLSTPILWRRQRPARGSRGMVSRDCWRWTYEAPAKPAGSRSAHKWCTAARTCFALERPCLRGHVFRAVSPGRVSRPCLQGCLWNSPRLLDAVIFHRDSIPSVRLWSSFIRVCAVSRTSRLQGVEGWERRKVGTENVGPANSRPFPTG
jgi:hypothetical protein